MVQLVLFNALRSLILGPRYPDYLEYSQSGNESIASRLTKHSRFEPVSLPNESLHDIGGTNQALQGSSNYLVCSQVKTEVLVCPGCQ